MNRYAARDTASTQPTVHSQHAAHIPQQHSTIAARHTEAAVAAGSSGSRTGHRARCAARLRGINLMSSADGSAGFSFAELLHCRPLPTILMLVRTHSLPLSKVDFLMALAVCCKLCIHNPTKCFFAAFN